MSDLMTTADMADGKLDLTTLKVYINGEENVVNEPRLAPGFNVGSLAALNKHAKDKVDLQIAKLPAGRKGYATLALAQAAQASLPANTIVEVVSDSTGSNNGVYLWNGTVLAKSTFDPAADAKAYADSVAAVPLNAAMHVNTDTTQTREVLIADKTGNGVLAYDTVTKKLIGNFDVKPTYTPKNINHFLFYGQSLSIGGGNTTVVSTTQPFSNLTFASAVDGTSALDFTATKPLVESTRTAIDGRADRGETPVSGACNAASLFAYRDNGIDPSAFQIFGSTGGKGGTVIDLLDKGEDWYNNKFLAHIWGAYKLSNGSYGLPCVGWLQGESDLDASTPTDYATYKAKLQQLRDDIQDYVYSLCNQRYPVFMLTYQLSYRIKTSDAVARAQFDLDRDNENFGIVSPTYIFPTNNDGYGHLSPVGYKWLGAYFGRAFKQVVFDKIKPKGIKPISAVKNGTAITVKFNVPQSPLKFDTTNLPPTTNQGFAVYDSTGANLTLSNVTVSNDTVTLTLAADNTNALIVKYAYDYLANPNSKQLNANSASGNLVDSTADSVVISGTSYPMFYACPHFILPVKKLEI